MSRALALALATVILALLLVAPHVGTQAQDQVEVRIRWVTYIDPTKELDRAYGICAFGDYIVVVGMAGLGIVDPTRPYKPYIALLRKIDGGVLKEWIGDDELGELYNCISIGGKLYAVGRIRGYGSVYVFDVDLYTFDINTSAKITSRDPSRYYSLAYDGKALYIGGAIGDFNKEDWLVEKRDPSNLSLIASRRIHLDSWMYGWVSNVGVEPSTGWVWAVGFYRDSNGKDHSLIIIFDSDLRELKVIDYPPSSRGYLGRLFGIAFDGRYVYITGGLGIAKFTVDGELVAVNRDYRGRVMIVYGYGYLYAFGSDKIGDYWRHVLYIHDINLYMVERYVLSENVKENLYFSGHKPILEGNNIYVVGYDSRIVVYSLLLRGVTTTATGTEGATATATTPVATTATVTITVPITQTATVTVTYTATVTKTDTITMGIPTTATITTTAPIYITVPTTITVSEGAPTQLIVAGLAAIGVILAIAFLLLRRR